MFRYANKIKNYVVVGSPQYEVIVGTEIVFTIRFVKYIAESRPRKVVHSMWVFNEEFMVFITDTFFQIGYWQTLKWIKLQHQEEHKLRGIKGRR